MLIRTILICILLSGCAKYDFDGFDPTTTMVRWIIKTDK